MKEFQQMREMTVYECDYCHKQSLHQAEISYCEWNHTRDACPHPADRIGYELSTYLDDGISHIAGIHRRCNHCTKALGFVRFPSEHDQLQLKTIYHALEEIEPP